MRMFALVSLVAVGLGLALVVREPAYARTRTPTATPTPTPTATPTVPPNQIARFGGQAWADGWVSDAAVTAKIGGVDCGRRFPLAIVCDPGPCGPMYGLDVVSSQIKPGCGYEGATIQFYVGDQPAQTAAWHGGSDQGIRLIAGPPFALNFGGFSWNGDLPRVDGAPSPGQTGALVPYVGDVACGHTEWLRRAAWLDTPIKSYEYGVVVFSDQQQAGCGYEGAPITYKLLDPNGNVIAVAREKGVWHAWDGMLPSQQLNPTFSSGGGIKLGNVGTGGSEESGTCVWTSLSLLLASLGLGGIAAGAALRRRARR